MDPGWELRSLWLQSPCFSKTKQSPCFSTWPHTQKPLCHQGVTPTWFHTTNKNIPSYESSLNITQHLQEGALTSKKSRLLAASVRLKDKSTSGVGSTKATVLETRIETSELQLMTIMSPEPGPPLKHILKWSQSASQVLVFLLDGSHKWRNISGPSLPHL